jgi:hypothetical protein
MPDAARARREEGGHGDDPFYHKDIEDAEFGFKNQEFRVFCDLRLDASRYFGHFCARRRILAILDSLFVICVKPPC